MVANDGKDRLSYLKVPAVFFGFFALMAHHHGHPKIGTQDVDAALTLLRPVVRQTCHGVHASETHSRLLVSKLYRSILVPLGQSVSLGPLGYACRSLSVDTDGLLGCMRRPLGRCARLLAVCA
jgi:hypothetical protein